MRPVSHPNAVSRTSCRSVIINHILREFRSETLVIRFNCPNCGRRYELPDLMAHLPLLCKGCGLALAVPDPEPEPEPAPPPFRPRPAKIEPKGPEKAEPKTEPKELSKTKPVEDVSGPIADPGDAEKAKSLAPAAELVSVSKPPAPEAAPPPTTAGRKLIPIVADVAVGLILLAVGVFLGEMLAQKPTGQVLSEAGSAAKFPPLDLIQWLGPPVLLELIYAMLASRGMSVGGWLKRRSG
jgi:hypothetical protein